jgi:hypothetical protein
VKPIVALTVWQPWASLIAHGRKAVENRSWEPDARLRPGDLVAIHAGTKKDLAQWDAAIKIAGELTSCGRFEALDIDLYSAPYGAIVGVATLDEVRSTPRGDDPWFFGPIGWYLRDAVAFKAPIRCAGSQGLWRPDTATVERMRVEWCRATQRAEVAA